MHGGIRLILGQQSIMPPSTPVGSPTPLVSPAPAPLQEPSLVSSLIPSIPSPASALQAAGPAVGPLNLPKWVNVGLGGLLTAVGLYATFKGAPGADVESMPTCPPPSKDGMTTIAGIGSIAGGAYILMESFGFKLGKPAG